MLPRVVLVTISDTRTVENDDSGRALADALGASCEIVRREIVRDEPENIAALVREITANRSADAIVTSGGTGIAPRDRTYEALESLFEKKLDGFGEAFRRISFDAIGPRAILSRATAGVVANVLVFALPGSVKGASLGARELIAPILMHAVDLVNGRTHHHHDATAATAAAKKKR